MTQRELFPVASYGTPRPSLSRARELVAEVEALAAWDADTDTRDWPDVTDAVARRAERVGAHSVARAVRWLAHPCSLDRHGYDTIHFRAEDTAHRWLARMEQEARP